MTTLAELEGRDDLPWGLHDALLLELHVDWRTAQLRLTCAIPTTEDQDEGKTAHVVVHGLVWLVVDPPGPGAGPAKDGLRMDTGSGVWPTERTDLPDVPEGAFVSWVFLSQRNAFLHVCGRDASLEWLDDAPRPMAGGALFPGEEIEDPRDAE